jgi:CRP-like cAMP-binding protein
VATIRVLGKDEHFGELAVLSPGTRTGAVAALDSAETLSWRADVIDELRRESPQIERMFTQALVEEIRRLAGALVEALYVAADDRVCRRLRALAELYGNGSSAVISQTQDDLAQLAGTTRSTVNRVLQRGVANGTLRLARARIEVLDISALGHGAR